MNRLLISSIVLLICGLGRMEAQQQTFGAGVVFGLNASQINGDDRAGYNKLGLHGGVRGIWNWKEQAVFSIGIQYSQRGSNQKLLPNTNDPLFRINTDFIDVPLTFRFRDWLVSDEGFDDFYRIEFQAGLTYSRLLSASAEETPYDEITNLFNEDQLGFLAGVTFYVNERVGVTGRFNQNFTLLFDRRSDPQFSGLNSLRPFWLTLRVEYIL